MNHLQTLLKQVLSTLNRLTRYHVSHIQITLKTSHVGPSMSKT